jgi:hypothetical protein
MSEQQQQRIWLIDILSKNCIKWSVGQIVAVVIAICLLCIGILIISIVKETDSSRPPNWAISVGMVSIFIGISIGIFTIAVRSRCNFRKHTVKDAMSNVIENFEANDFENFEADDVGKLSDDNIQRIIRKISEDDMERLRRNRINSARRRSRTH